MDYVFPDEFWDVLIKRYERMPLHTKVVIGTLGVLGRDKIIEHLKKRDKLGTLFMQIELNYLKFEEWRF